MNISSLLLIVLALAGGQAAPPRDASLAAARSRAILDVLVFYADLPRDLQRYPSDVRRELQRYVRRTRAYRPRPRPARLGSEMRMLYNAREGYEAKLAAAATGLSDASPLARAYVDELKPCYEWEGFHDCPEQEAECAEAYLAREPGSPFAEFLRLLAAHRWLCAAEGYDHEKKASGAARSRRKYEDAVAAAAQAQSPLIRSAVEELKTSGRCHASDPFRPR